MGTPEKGPSDEQKRSTETIKDGIAFIQFVAQMLKESEEAAQNTVDESIIIQTRKLLLDRKIVAANVSKRIAGQRDQRPLKPGEHPGIHFACRRDDGSILHINVKGGLRELISNDLKDTTKSYSVESGQSGRTLNAITDPTQINLNVINQNGEKELDIWMETRLAGREPTSIRRVECLGAVAIPNILIPKTLTDFTMENFGVKQIIRKTVRVIGD